MNQMLARILIVGLLLFPSLTLAAPINVNGGGTGTTTVRNGGYLVGGSDPLRLSATTSPTADYFTASSTTATSSLPRLSISTAISLLGEYITNLTTWVRAKIDAYLTGDQGITYSGGSLSFDCSEVEGTGIDCVGENITLDATGAWTGTFDGLEGTVYLARANHTGTQAASTITGDTFGSGSFIFPAGVMALGSTTVGDGTQGGGLAISGGATTTGNAYFESSVLIGTSTLSATQISANDALVLGKNKGIYLNTDTPTVSAEGLIKLHFLTNEAKAILAYVNQLNEEVIWLQAHDYLSYPGNQHKHFSIEASDAAGLKQTRFSVGYGADVIDVNTNQANFYVNGADGYEIIDADYDGILKMTPVDTVDIYPQSQAARALRIDDTGNTVSLSALGSTFLQVNDSIYANGNLGVGTSSMINSLEPSITLSGTIPAFYIEDTQVSESANGRLFRLVNSGGDFQIWESGRSGTATVGSSNLFNITSLGNVGIGSTTPWAQLSVNPNGITGPAFAIGSSTKTDFVVTNSGNVGIGTTTPVSKLQVADPTSAIFTLSDMGASENQKHWFIESDAGRFKIGTTSDALTTDTPRSMQILPNGDIGFNKIPVYAFDVGGANSTDNIGLFRVNGTYTGNASLGNNVIDLSPTMNLNAAGGSITVVRSAPTINPTVDLNGVTNGNNNMAFSSGSNTITSATLHTGALQLGAGFSGNVGTLRNYNAIGISNSGAGTVTNFVGFIAGNISGATNNVGLQLCNANVQAGTFGINTLCDFPNIMRASTTAESNYPLAMYSARAGIVSGDSLGNIGFLSNDTNYTAPGQLAASFGAVAEAGHNASTKTTGLAFRTTDAGSGALTTEKVRITGAGNLGVGTTTPYAKLAVQAVAGDTNRSVFAVGSSTAAFATTTLFDVTRTGAVYAPNTTSSGSSQTGYWCYDADGQLIRTSTTCLVSALRFKEHIDDMDAGLATVLRLRPVTYDLKDTMGDPNNADRQFGFIAEEARNIDPRLVTRNSEGDVQSFRYEQYTAVLTKAVQDLNAKVDGKAMGAVTGAARSVHDQWQWAAIVLLLLGLGYQQVQIKRLRK